MERARRALVPLGIVLNVLGCWVHWEAVVKPLISKVGWGVEQFPSPFYLFWAPLYFWHDLAYTLIIFGTLILGYYAVKDCANKSGACSQCR
jgi:hypothetical protein